MGSLSLLKRKDKKRNEFKHVNKMKNEKVKERKPTMLSNYFIKFNYKKTLTKQMLNI